MDPRAPSRKTISAASDLGRYAGLGAQFVGSIALVGALGWWLDGKFGTSPWLLITGIFAGAVGGFIAMLRAVPPARGVTHRGEHAHEDQGPTHTA
jgi:F0F1-type ATP synthase assembly protein I